MCLKRKSLSCPEEQPCAQGEQGFILLGGVAMFIEEQMCLKFCLIVTFSYEF